MQNDRKLETIKAVFGMVANSKITPQGLHLFKAIVDDSPSDGTNALEDFLLDNPNKAVSFLDTLYETDRALFVKALSKDCSVLWLCNKGQGQWVINKLDALTNNNVAEIFSAHQTFSGLFADHRQWVIDELDTFENEDIAIAFSNMSAICVFAENDHMQYILDRLDTLNNEQITKVLSTDDVAYEIVENGHEQWLMDKIDTLENQQAKQILSTEWLADLLEERNHGDWLEKYDNGDTSPPTPSL